MDDRRTRSHPVRRVIATALTAVALASLVLTVPGAALAFDPTVSIDASWTRVGSATVFTPATGSLRVGDELTIRPVLDGFATPPSCLATFSRGSSLGGTPLYHAHMNPCRDWTLIVPPSPAGPYAIGILVTLTDGFVRPELTVDLEDGGVARPVTSNVPLGSWDLATIFGATPTRFGETWTISAPTNAQHSCEMTLNGNYLTGLTTYGSTSSCADWQVSLPDIRPAAYRSSEPNGSPWRVEAIVYGSLEDATGWVTGQMDTDSGYVEDAVGAASFTSDRPAVIFAADDNPYYTYVGTVRREARSVGLTSGTCTYEVKNVGDSQAMPAGVVPITGGTCPAVEFEVTQTGVFQVFLYIQDASDRRIAAAWTGGEVIDPLPAPVIDAPEEGASGEPVDIDASTASGTPLDYEIEPALQSAAASARTRTTASVTPTCTGATGTFLLATNQRSATATCTFPSSGTYVITARFIDAVGTERTTTRAIAIDVDGVAPTVSAVRQRLVPGTQIGTSAIPVQMTWTATDVGSGVHHVRVDQQLDAGTWALVNDHLTAASMTRSLSRGHDYRFRVRAVDGASNTSPYAYSATFGPTAYTETNPIITYTGPWATTVSADAYGGTMRGTSAAGASATITFHGRSVAWVSPWSPVRGKAKVYLDGKLVSTVDLYRATLSQRRIAFAWNWTTAATHTLKIVNEATAGHRRIDVDTIVVLD